MWIAVVSLQLLDSLAVAHGATLSKTTLSVQAQRTWNPLKPNHIFLPREMHNVGCAGREYLSEFFVYWHPVLKIDTQVRFWKCVRRLVIPFSTLYFFFVCTETETSPSHFDFLRKKVEVVHIQCLKQMPEQSRKVQQPENRLPRIQTDSISDLIRSISA